MSDKLPMTRRGIYLTNLQWVDAKAAGNGNYSAGVRLWMEALEAEKVEREATIERYIDANGELVLQVDNLTVERDTLHRECDEQQTKIDRLRADLVDERDRAVMDLQQADRRAWRRHCYGYLAACMAIAATLAVLEGIDKAWW